MIPYIYKHPDGRILLCHKDWLLSASLVDESTLEYLRRLCVRPIAQIGAAQKAIDDLIGYFKNG